MGFFKSIKDKLGIGGVSIKLDIPGQVAKETGKVDGKMILTTKSDQEVLSYNVRLVEEYSTGRGDDKSSKHIDLGKIEIKEGFTIKPGETKEIAFSVPFTMVKSSHQELKEKGGALGALGKLSSFASNESSEYFVEAEVDVKAAALDPLEKKDIRII